MSASRIGLVLLEQGGLGRELEVPRSGQITIGSDPSRAGLLLQAEGVAAEHCRIGRLVNGGWALRDLGSPAGTRVNGSPVDSKRLGHGDRLQLGVVQLVVIDPALEALPTAAGAERDSGEATGAVHEIELHGSSIPGSGRRDPNRIGGYRIQRKLGRGAFGHVWLAIQESLQRETALKILSPALAHNRDFVVRFQAEARAAASLSHPNVVVVYDVGEADGHHFLSMEYMANGSLEERLNREGSMPWRVVLGIAIDAARGLVYAEQRGIVHRDIKPANLMQSEAGVTKIADLGLAVSIDAASSAEALGTAHFASPEQARGEAVDHRSDLYSLGASAFRLLTGHTPFEGDSKREILNAVFHETPPLATELAPDTPVEFANLIARLLAKDPAQRPDTARQLLFELEHLRVRFAPNNAGARPRNLLFRSIVALTLLIAVASLAFLYTRSEEGSKASAPGEERSRSGISNAPLFGDESALSTPPETDSQTSPADDRALELLEDRARGALIALNAVREDSAREAGLRDLLERYRGTTAAVEAEQQLLEIEARAAGRATVLAERQGKREAILTQLRTDSGIDSDSGSILAGLKLIRDFTPPLAERGSREFDAALRDLRQEFVEQGLESVREALDEADTQAQAGEFDLASATLVRARGRLGVRELRAQSDLQLARSNSSVLFTPPAPDTAGLDLAVRQSLFEADARLENRIARLEQDQVDWREARGRLDRRQRALGLRSGIGLEAELTALDFDSARSRLNELAKELQTDAERSQLAVLAKELSEFESVLATLTREFEAGNWRRKAIVDPRPGSAGARQVVGFGEKGWLMAADGRPELLPHAALMRSSAALENLFRARIARRYTPAEQRGIAFGMRLAAVLEVLDLLTPAFAESPPRLSRDQLGPYAEPLDRALEWARLADDETPALREQTAVNRFLSALASCSEGAWTSAHSELEALASENGGALFVMLISDGSPADE